MSDLRILVVDDMGSMRKVVAKVCRDMGFKDITEAADGAEAWTKVQSASPALGLIISDWNMPGTSGLDLLRLVKGDEKFKKTPFIMVTAESEAHQIAEAIKVGVDSYVVKPVSQAILKEKIEAILKKFSAA